MIYFFTESYTYKPDVSVSDAGGSTIAGREEEFAVDYDQASWWENDGATPDLIIDLGAAYLIDSLWFLQYNISSFTLWHSDDGAIWTEVVDAGKTDAGNDVYFYFAFTEQTKRYWKISVAGKDSGGENVKIFEVMLMYQRLVLDDEAAPKIPMVTRKDRTGGSYTMVDGSEQSYSGDYAFADIRMEWEFLAEAEHNSLYLIYSSPMIRPALTILPREDFPEQIFRCVWGSTDFDFQYTIAYGGAGFSGTLEWREY